MSRSKGAIGLWLLVMIVGFTMLMVLVLDHILDNSITNFIFRTVLRNPARVKAEVKVQAQMQDAGRNLTALLMMKKSELTYGEILSSQRAGNIGDTPVNVEELTETLEKLEVGLALLNESGEVLWEHGETFKDSPSMDMPLPGLNIGRLVAQ
jgi:hypothetical protein